MEIDTFEKLLVVELTESMTSEPELWEKSIWGIKRKDGLDIYMQKDDLYIKEPTEYIFKNSEYKTTLYNIANNLYDKITLEWETELYNEIIKSLSDDPDKWEKSIWGIKQKGDFDSDLIELELENSTYSGKKVKLKKPYSHKFNSSHSQTLLKIGFEVLDYIEKKEKAEKEQKSRDSLSKFLNFDDRKHKLKILQIIAEEKEAKEKAEKAKAEKISEITKKQEPVHKKKNFFQKLFNL